MKCLENISEIFRDRLTRSVSFIRNDLNTTNLQTSVRFVAHCFRDGIKHFYNMTEGTAEKLTTENNSKGLNISTSTSSFEALDPHDPNLSRLATTLFQKTSDYLAGELTSTQEHYVLLEEVNRLTITKYADLRQIAVNLGKTVNEYNDLFNATIRPLLSQIDVVEEQVSKFEASAYRLDHYTKQLRTRFKELEEK